MKRTDIHRKGAIIPADYEHVLSYNLATMQDGWPVPSFGVNCELDRRTIDKDKVVENGKHDPDGRCCIMGLRNIARVKWAVHGTNGQCTACGAHFKYGEVWRHRSTGEHIHVGHICGHKYGLIADRTEFDIRAERARKVIAAQYIKEQNSKERAEFLADHPGLEEALNMDHQILTNLAHQFKRHRSLSDKQVALALKIANEIKNPETKEKHCQAPIGKQKFVGIVVGSKVQEGFYGFQVKITVRVETPEGSWLAYGTAPSTILDASVNHGGLKGCQIEISATLTRSDRDEFFAFMKRPRGKLLAFAHNHDSATCTGCQLDC